MNPKTGTSLGARLLVRLRAPDGRGRTGARGRARRKAVRSLAWGAAAFVLTTLAFSVAVEMSLPEVRDPEYGARLVRFHAEGREQPNRPVVVVLGTSRTQNAIDPLAMEFPDEPGAPLVFNFGHAGIRPLHLRLILWRLHAAGVRPAAALVEVFPGFLGVSGPSDTAFPDAGQLTAAELDWLAPHLDDPDALRRRWVRSRLDPWSAHRGVLLSRLAPGAVPWALRIDYAWAHDARGFLGYPDGVATDERRAAKLADVHRTYGPTLADLRVSAATDAAYRGLVADARVRGVPVAFFLAPESPTYRSWYTPQSHAELGAFTRTLRDELGCPVFDAPIDFAEEDFADGHHILRPAAARFSRALADKHLKAWLAGGR